MLGKIVPKNEREADFKKLDKLILQLENDADTNNLTIPLLKSYQQSLDKLIIKYKYDTSFGPNDRGLFKPGELHALIFLAQGNEHMADSLLRDAKSLMKPDEEWVSLSAKKWDSHKELQPEKNQAPSNNFNGKLEGWLALYSLNFVVVPALLLYDLFVSLPEAKKQLTSITGQYTNISSDFQTLINFSTIYDVLVLVVLIVLGYYFFTKSKGTRALAIFLHCLILIGGFILYSMMSDIGSKTGTSSDDTSGSFLTLGSFIWPIYWIFSKRVKATFVN